MVAGGVSDPVLEQVIRLLLAALLGAVIGFEREVHGRPAGFRTHLLVGLGSCLFVLASVHFYRAYANFGGAVPFGVDPGRVAAQVVTGIGFLGAGAIIRDKASVRGLTTAACLWVTAALGVACGIGMYAVALVATLISMLSLLLLKKVEYRISRDAYVTLSVWTEDREGQLSRIEAAISGCLMPLVNTSMERDVAGREISVEYSLKYSTRELAGRLIDDIAALPGVKRVRLD